MDFLNFDGSAEATNSSGNARKNIPEIADNVQELHGSSCIKVQPFRDPEKFDQSPYIYGYQQNDIDEELILTPLMSPELTSNAAFSEELIGTLEVTHLVSPLLSPVMNTSALSPTNEDGQSSKQNFLVRHHMKSRATAPNSPRFSSSSVNSIPIDAASLANSLNMLASKINNYNGRHPITPASLMNIRNPSAPSSSGAFTSFPSPKLNAVNNNISAKVPIKSVKDTVGYINENDFQVKYPQDDTSMGLELRRSNHKIAEQRRRDSIKKCFQDLKLILPNLNEKNPSKLYILQKTFDYVLHLQERQKSAARAIEDLKREVESLRSMNNS